MYPFVMEHGSGDRHKGDQCAVPMFRFEYNHVESSYQEDRIVDGNTLYRFCCMDKYEESGREMVAIQRAD